MSPAKGAGLCSAHASGRTPLPAPAPADHHLTPDVTPRHSAEFWCAAVRSRGSPGSRFAIGLTASGDARRMRVSNAKPRTLVVRSSSTSMAPRDRQAGIASMHDGAPGPALSARVHQELWPAVRLTTSAATVFGITFGPRPSAPMCCEPAVAAAAPSPSGTTAPRAQPARSCKSSRVSRAGLRAVGSRRPLGPSCPVTPGRLDEGTCTSHVAAGSQTRCGATSGPLHTRFCALGRQRGPSLGPTRSW